MALSHNPRIVTDGLVLCLDAANPKSYPGSGTTWYDLSGNGNDGSITSGSPVFSNNDFGSFQFSLGSNDRFTIQPSKDFDISNGNFSVELFMKMSTLGNNTNTYYGIFAVGNSQGSISDLYLRQWRSGLYPGSVFNRINNIVALGYNSNIDTRISGEGWYQIVIVENSGTMKMVFNGSVIESISTPSYPSSGNNWFNVGTDESLGSFDGEISQIRFYQKALTNLEIKQNFNALRGRYGI